MNFRSGLTRNAVITIPFFMASCTATPPSPPTLPSAPPPPAPFYIDGGAGSEHGNFTSQPDGEMIGPGGAHCVTYVWDRPLTAQTALRLRSASCEQPAHSGLYVATELERVVIPLASSTLADGAAK